LDRQRGWNLPIAAQCGHHVLVPQVRHHRIPHRSHRQTARNLHPAGMCQLLHKRRICTNPISSRSREQVQRAERERAATQAVRERLTPLEERLARLLVTIPMEMQREGLSLASLQASLRGRWRGNCHPGELGGALRKVGFKRERRRHAWLLRSVVSHTINRSVVSPLY
jgi:hypothetical protein